MPVPTILIQDTIQSSATGGPQTAGTGWSGSGIIYAANDGPHDGFTPSFGPYGLQWFRLAATQLFSSTLTIPLLTSTFFFSAMGATGNLGAFTELIYLVFDPLLGRQVPVFFLVGQPDGSVSAVTADGQIIFNSGKLNNIYLYNLEWYYYQVNVTFSSSSGFINVDCSIAIQGISVGSGTVTTGILSTHGLGMNQFQFQSGATGGVGLSNMALCDQVPLALTNPSNYITQPSIGPPNTTPNAVIQQLLSEIARLPTNANAIMQQLLIEVGNLPTNTNLVIQQMVIEIAITGKFLVGQNFPEYHRRKNIGM